MYSFSNDFSTHSSKHFLCLVGQDLVGTQLLSEAEEVIQYKLIPERRPILREVWRSRLRGCQAVVEDWGQIIQLRSLVMEPQEDLKTWLRFVGLCRRNGRFVSVFLSFGC